MSAAFVLPVDKAPGPTSHDVVAIARRALRERRIGHTGTLDPFASGLLLLCVGPATRLAEYLTGLDKTYEAVLRLGCRTDTLDLRGEVLEEHDGWRDLDPSAIEAAFATQTGTLDQVPPQYSAKKVDGVRMYERARRGESVELEPTRVTVHELTVVEVAPPLVRFRVRCSSGTYIRSIARDVGDALGVGAHLTSLRRTAVGEVSVEGALSPDDLDDADAVRDAAIGPLEAVAHMPRVTVDDGQVERLRHGQRVELSETPEPGLVAIAGSEGLVAIGEARGTELRPRKVFAS